MEQPILLYLGCGAGGASFGYNRVGFLVIGVDIESQPHYPFQFIKADMLEILQAVIAGDVQVDAIHASPPCQRFSKMTKCRPGLNDTHVDLIEPVRFLLRRTNLPYVIENVPGSPLVDPVTLCGSQFGLRFDWDQWPSESVYLRRHRLFETHGFDLPDAGEHDHSGAALTVAGHGRPDRRFKGAKNYTDAARRLMQCPWMTQREIREAVPPAYTAYVGAHLMNRLRTEYVLTG